MARACIGIGSNIGPRQANLDRAIQMLDECDGVRVVARSRVKETPPEDCPAGSPLFLNAALVVETELPARQLLFILLGIEEAMGRPPADQRQPGQPRIIDLDLLLYEDESINESGLTLPHPRMHMRRFVLEPLAQIAPDYCHPLLGVSVAELLNWLDACVTP